ncbi:MAG: tetratricopeptide repeat protein [Candidatus Cloacimonadota bacterium]|nr:MAG: tetratricopeptide repeat protein [Candidatus Cloacimonadota bacterium]
MAKIIRKKKVTKHKLKEDRFLETTKNFITFFRANSSRVILAVIILLGVVIAVNIYFANRRNAEETARVKILYSNSLYENGNFKEAVSSYLEVVNMHGGTKTAKIATLFLANSYFFSGDMDNALLYYEKSLDILKRNPNWASSAAIGIASVFEQKGMFEEAIKKYTDVIVNYKDTPARIDALFSKARCLEFTNCYTEAIEVYLMIENEYPDAVFADEAKKRIVFLRGATESERIPK